MAADKDATESSLKLAHELGLAQGLRGSADNLLTDGVLKALEDASAREAIIRAARFKRVSSPSSTASAALLLRSYSIRLPRSADLDGVGR